MNLSLIVAYRNRLEHLEQLVAHFRKISFDIDIEIILMEGDQQPTLEPKTLLLPYMEYHHVPMDGVFHKAKLLNMGLELSRGDYVIPYDVDLLPLNSALTRTYRLAKASPSVLVSGYRLMSPMARYNGNPELLGYAPEDSQSAVKKQLLHGERFGVCPTFSRQRLMDIGGWDEQYQGWGAEDQDIIERYCGVEIELARFASLMYVHLDHEPSAGWNDAVLTQRNRELYRKLKGQRISLI